MPTSLLVLINSRTVYDPNNSNVRWNAENVFLEDVEQMKWCESPGGTLWRQTASTA